VVVLHLISLQILPQNHFRRFGYLFDVLKSSSIHLLQTYFLIHLATISNDDLCRSFSWLGSIGFDLLDNFHAFNNWTENNMLSIQPRRFGGTQEKLRTVGVGTSIGHGEDSWAGMLQLKVFIFELVSVDWFSTSSVVVCEVTTLTHEVGDDPVEWRSLESETLLSGTETTEVFCCLWDNIWSQLHHNPSNGLPIGGNIKEASWSSRHFVAVLMDVQDLSGF